MSNPLARFLRNDLAIRGSRKSTKRRSFRKSRLGFDVLQMRRLLAVETFVFADGTVADRDLGGTFETVETTDTHLRTRWISAAGFGRDERVLERRSAHCWSLTSLIRLAEK